MPGHAVAQNIRFHGRSTALFSRFTLVSPSVKELPIDSITLCPARLEPRIRSIVGVAAKRCPRRSSSLSSSSSRMLDNSGESGPPWACPWSLTDQPTFHDPRLEIRRISLSTRFPRPSWPPGSSAHHGGLDRKTSPDPYPPPSACPSHVFPARFRPVCTASGPKP